MINDITLITVLQTFSNKIILSTPVYPEYYKLPQPLTITAIYVSAIISVIVFLLAVRNQVKPYGAGLWDVILAILRGYRRWPGYIYDVLIHRRHLGTRGRHGIGHLLMFYGLIFAFIGSLLVALNEFFGPTLEYYPYSGMLFLGYSLFLDIIAWVLFIGSLMGLISLLLRIKNYTRREITEYLVYLIGFMFLAVSGALIEDYRVYTSNLINYIEYFPNAELLGRIPMSFQAYMALYYIHFLLAFALIAAIPYTSIAHSYLSLVNYVTRERRSGELSRPFDLKVLMQNPDAEIKMGIKSYKDLKWVDAINPLACVECNRCQEVCPAYAAGRELSPTKLMMKLRREILGKVQDLFQSISEDEIWSCTTCGACVTACPVYIRHIDFIVDFRRRLVFDMKLDTKKSSLLLNLSQYNNSMGLSNTGRHDWLKELGVKTVQENQNFEYLLWVGCMGSFDNRARDIIKALIELLKNAGMLDKIAILGDEETCCGDPARRLGEESRFQEMAYNNIDIFRKYNVKNIITICPHGYNTFKNEYPKLDAWMRNVKVYHHVELLEELIKQGKIKISRNNIVFTIHDPCYLARHNEIVNPQRFIVKNLGEIREAKNHGTKTFCCGAGGANYWYDVPEKKRISHIRLEQLMETNANTIVTLCPFCNAMLTDAARVKGVEDKVKIIDIAEVIRETMRPAEVVTKAE